MSTEVQRVVVIQDASRDVSSKAIIGFLEKFSVKAGDQLIIVAILDWISSPMGYMVRANSTSSIISTNKKITLKRHTKKKEEYLLNEKIKKIYDYCKSNEIGFQIEVLLGPAAEVAFNAAKEFQATSLVLVRQILKDLKQLTRNLPCGMYRITSDNSIERLKDPKTIASIKALANRQENVSYNEMFPGSEEEERSQQMSRASSSDLLTSSGVSSQWSTEISTSSLRRPKIGWKRDFNYAELHAATQGFSLKNFLSEGGFGSVYREHSRSPLSWEDRINIATGAAKGLLYLHRNNIIHRDLGDFGLARNQNQDSIHSTEVIGTFGYLAPEYAEHGKVSTKTDVYSFGVVLLQLITGMRITDKRLEGRSLVGWARPLLKVRNYPDLIDERITNSHDVLQLYWMVRLAEKCLSRDPQMRLNMTQVVDALTDIAEGRTCDLIIRDYSPARSDSIYSASDSNESEDEMQGSFKCEDELLSQNSECILSNSVDQITQMFVRQPPSPPIQSISSSNSSSFKFHDESISDGEEPNEGDLEISKSNVVLLNY
ncbi:hypothetical protein Fmac_011745 [Flemingia macrophylla]|uniref:Protein kinase domain-containing protein n=1 Tax=Flemingia macrophylla TaxID=520843 RepID=A0ABD1MNC0_9FABA